MGFRLKARTEGKGRVSMSQGRLTLAVVYWVRESVTTPFDPIGVTTDEQACFEIIAATKTLLCKYANEVIRSQGEENTLKFGGCVEGRFQDGA